MLGNDEIYDLINISSNPNKYLKNKKIIFLGSSVTLGAASFGISFADYLAKIHDLTYIKEAVNGTTLVDIEENSYISRLKKINPNFKPDYFVCQLSTNDATRNISLGNIDDKETDTILGAINFIIDYVNKKWNIKTIFYTSPKYQSSNYLKMVLGLKKLEENKKVLVVDLYNDTKFNSITAEEYNLYMADPIHPTKAGYLLWWVPFFEKKLSEIIKNEEEI